MLSTPFTQTPATIRRSALRCGLVGSALIALCAVSGCASGPTASTGNGNATAAPTPTAMSSQSGDAPLVVAEAWAMAKPQLGDMPMTAVFAQIVNRDSKPVTVVSATASASDKTELHQTTQVNGKSQMKRVSQFKLNPGVAEVLQPGGDHIMVMDMKKPLAPGDVVTVTLKTSDGKSKTFTAVAKTFTGANEPYAESGHSAGASPSAGSAHSHS